MTQEDLADRSGNHPTEISRLENQQRDPRFSTIVRIARALDVPVSHLTDGIE